MSNSETETIQAAAAAYNRAALLDKWPPATWQTPNR